MLDSIRTLSLGEFWKLRKDALQDGSGYAKHWPLPNTEVWYGAFIKTEEGLVLAGGQRFWMEYRPKLDCPNISKPVVFTPGIYVLTPYRGLRLGKALLSTISDVAITMGVPLYMASPSKDVEKLYSKVATHEDPALGLYIKEPTSYARTYISVR